MNRHERAIMPNSVEHQCTTTLAVVYTKAPKRINDIRDEQTWRDGPTIMNGLGHTLKSYGASDLRRCSECPLQVEHTLRALNYLFFANLGKL